MEAPERARSMAARAARPTSFLSCHRTSMWAPPPVGGTFWFQIFIQASSPEIWRKTIFGGEEGCWRGKWGGPFWATSLEKIFGGVIAIISFRSGEWMQQSAVPRCAILSVGEHGRHRAVRRRDLITCSVVRRRRGRSQRGRSRAACPWSGYCGLLRRTSISSEGGLLSYGPREIENGLCP
jgi:hypothetical protein